ncbi:MAG: hypothetical protein ABIH99_00135 [Candidatus Micrarchaeota archaeon]
MHARPNMALFKKLNRLNLPLIIYNKETGYNVRLPGASPLDMDFLLINEGQTVFIAAPLSAEASKKEILTTLKEAISSLIADKDNHDFERFFIVPYTSNHYVSEFHPSTLAFLMGQKKKLLHDIDDFDMGAHFLKNVHARMGASKIPHDVFLQDIVARVWDLRNTAGMINDTRYIRGPPVSSKMIKTGIHVTEVIESHRFSKIILSFNFGDGNACSNHILYVEPHITREEKKKFCVSCLIPLEMLKEAAQTHELSVHLLHKFQSNQELLDIYIEKLNTFLCDPISENFIAALDARKNIEIHILDERQRISDYTHIQEILTELACD